MRTTEFEFITGDQWKRLYDLFKEWQVADMAIRAVGELVRREIGERPKESCEEDAANWAAVDEWDERYDQIESDLLQAGVFLGVLDGNRSGVEDSFARAWEEAGAGVITKYPQLSNALQVVAKRYGEKWRGRATTRPGH